MQITIRKARADDYDSFCELTGEVDALHRDHLPRLFQLPHGPARERDYYRELIADENVGLLVAEEAGHIAGYVHVVLRDAPPVPVFVPRRYAVVESVVVAPAFQKRGIGRRLMDAAQEWAIAKEATSIELNVYEFNETAIEFYEGLGYRTFSRKMSKDLKSDKPTD